VIRDIGGRHNQAVKLARKLQRKSFRRERGLFVAEGMDLLVAAAKAGADLQSVLVRRDLVEGLPAWVTREAERGREDERAGLQIGVCDRETLEYASSLGGSADVIFVGRQPSWSLADLALAGRLSLFLDSVGDPGNVGTLVRACAAFGAAGMVCSPGTADPYGPKALRAGMGAQFATRIVVEVTALDLKTYLDGLVARGTPIPQLVVADEGGDLDVAAAGASGGAIIVLGSERAGPKQQWGAARRVRIPQAAFDSLNVAMAGTIMLYELGRANRRGVG